MKSEKKSEYKRPTWDEYFMEITEAVAKRSTCDRGRMGCVIARDKQILVTGYAGAPSGLPHCDEVGHQMKTVTNEDGTVSKHCMRTTHAEHTLYCKMTPCSTCAKMIINAGIKRVVCQKKYHAGKETEEMFKTVGIKLEFMNDEIEHYDNQ